jgi:putative membrane protein
VPELLAQLKILPWFRGSVMLDLVFLAMGLVVPVLLVSVALVRYRGMYTVHKYIQLTLGIVLLLAVAAFEVDMQLFTDWEELAVGSPYYQPGEWNVVWYSLIVHLCFAIPTPILWIVVMVRALRNFSSPPRPGPHSRSHVFWARMATVGMLLTAVTGWVFYYLAFIAS